MGIGRGDGARSTTLPAEVMPGDLVLTDLGFFRVGTFSQYHHKGAFFLSRFLQKEIPRLLKACWKAHQPSRLTTLQRLDLILPLPLPAPLP